MIALETLDSGRLGELSAFINQCWREAYRGILDDGFLDGLTTRGRLTYLRPKFERGLTGLAVRERAELIGLTLFGPTHLAGEAPALAGAGELNMLYVRGDHLGTGLGHTLMTAAESSLVKQGYSVIGLDVFSLNVRAVRFYEAHGYAKIGSKTDTIEGREYGLDIMAKTVEVAGASADRWI